MIRCFRRQEGGERGSSTQNFMRVEDDHVCKDERSTQSYQILLGGTGMKGKVKE